MTSWHSAEVKRKERRVRLQVHEMLAAGVKGKTKTKTKTRTKGWS